MGSYCICRVICQVVYNGELLHMLSWSVWGSIMGSYYIC